MSFILNINYKKLLTINFFIFLFTLISDIKSVEYPYECQQKDRENKICTLEYIGVCGWFNESVKCLAFPCAVTSATICTACTDPRVKYVTLGECPEI